MRTWMRGAERAGWMMVVLVLAMTPGLAWACGGCFSPVLPPPPGQVGSGQAVLQSAERVVFMRDEASKTSRVWVEVRYTGAAQDFGWVLPLPKQPTVTVGTTVGLDMLDGATAARYLTKPMGNENCRDPSDGCDDDFQWGGVTDAAGGGPNSGADAGSSDGGTAGGVTILDQGQAGPYDYSVIKGSDASKLQEWLDTRGYKTPTSATPIIQSHADKGDVFVAIKLQNGKGIEQIRPVVLEMHDAEPCVPLRLTSIAATDDLNVVVTLAGTGRAIPKNMMHVELNLARINWLSGANNYEQVVAAAIDEAAGRAFLTESAQKGSDAAKGLPSDALLDTKWAAEATNAYDLAIGLYNADPGGSKTPWLHPDAAKIFVEKAGIVEPIFKTFGLKDGPAALAQLWACGSIWSGNTFSPIGNDTCIPAGESFFSPSATWEAKDAKLVPADGKAFAAGLQKEIVAPLRELREQFAAAPVATRLVMKIGPTEMDRDPVFGFNAELPMVERDRTAKTWQVCDDGWLPASHTRVEIPGVGSYLFPIGTSTSANDSRWGDSPFAQRIDVLDESGKPIPVPVAQVELVDTAIAGALPGTPSPATKLALNTPNFWKPPASDEKVTKLGVWKKPGWCDKARAGWVDGKLPPSGGGDTDASNGGDTDAGSTANDGTGTGLDGSSGGGGTDTTPRKSEGGCTAAPTGSSNGALAWLVLLAAGLLLLRRRLFGSTN
ncbi:MAG: DUF2330 domain-containing protein [Deltaproteobacteria bacterium]|nr:DUF2330 domain-containing protein [Deltaproteobacteria bacterium]